MMSNKAEQGGAEGCGLQADFEFYLVTDTHYYASTLGAVGAEYEKYMRREQICLAENSAIAHAVFERIAADPKVNTVIIPGDLTKNGEKESHREFIRELERLGESGKKVFAITARHDWCDTAVEFREDGRFPVEGTSRDELAELYADFGFSDALDFDARTQSYFVRLAPGLCMLALNSDGVADAPKGSFDAEQMRWISARLEEAKREGCFVFAINHYPILPSAPVFSLVGDAVMKNGEEIAAFLADSGVPLVLTGHMHIQSINKFVSEQGNVLYDICTAALVGSPAMFRKITITPGGTVKVKSLPVPELQFNGETVNREYFDRRFRQSIENRICDAPSKLVVFALRHMTVGGLGRLLLIRVDKSIRHVRLMELAQDIVLAVFAGDAPYTSGTPVYSAVSKALMRLSPLLRIAEKKLERNGRRPDLKKIILASIGADAKLPDNDAEFRVDGWII